MSGVRKMPRHRASRNISSIMRCALDIPLHLVQQAQLYAPTRHPLDAVCYVLEQYPNLVSEVRQLRKALAEFDSEAQAFDDRLEALHAACRAILDL